MDGEVLPVVCCIWQRRNQPHQRSYGS
jgi:hypothetical protein